MDIKLPTCIAGLICRLGLLALQFPFDSTHALHDTPNCDAAELACSPDLETSSSAFNSLYKHQSGTEEKFNIKGQLYHLVPVNQKPPIFEISNFLTEKECDHLMRLAREEGLQTSQTRKGPISATNIRLRDVDEDKELSLSEMMLTLEDNFDIYLEEEDLLIMYESLKIDSNGDSNISQEELQNIKPTQLVRYLQNYISKKPRKKSRFSEQVWLYPDQTKDTIFYAIQQRVHAVTKLPYEVIRTSDFQIVRYGVGGHYNAHHDSSPILTDVPCCTRSVTNGCRICRYMTVLFYLNEVEEGGGTAFPVAGNETLDTNKLRIEHKINLQRHCNDAPLVVLPERGKAVMWYNHHINEKTGWLGEMDEFTWHGGCPVVKGEKWIANFWIKTTDNKEKDMCF